MKILIVGAGGVGGYYGTVLARAGHDVTFVARGAHGKAIREHGIVVVAPEGELTAKVPVVEDVRDAAGLGAAVAIVAVKSSSLASVADGIGKALALDGVAIPLLNGLDSEAELAEHIGKNHVIGGVAQINARIESPGRITVAAPASIVLAPLTPDQMPLVERLAKEFTDSGVKCDARSDLARVLWQKLLWNAPFNAICALTRRSAGEVLAVPELEALVLRTMHELAAVARAEGVVIEEQVIAMTIQATKHLYGNSMPSMLVDLLAGRTTEARELQGAVSVRGARHGIPTPLHDALLALMLGVEQRPVTEARPAN
ncbi:MAG TPA: 2-dehydropantoate 2-reductase [Polyangiaceae bacterium]|jgi:2-dehydropantoate 2-reductase|nr:2-dehydropantoate 2-reductase [Polyangiaceae bacterium]